MDKRKLIIGEHYSFTGISGIENVSYALSFERNEKDFSKIINRTYSGFIVFSEPIKNLEKFDTTVTFLSSEGKVRKVFISGITLQTEGIDLPSYSFNFIAKKIKDVD